MKTSKKGFTLIELIVVLAILAIVAAIAVPTAFGSIEKARVSADKATVDALNSAIRVEAALSLTSDGTTPTVTVATALTDAKLENDKVQSAGAIAWVPGAAGEMGHFAYYASASAVPSTATGTTVKTESVSAKIGATVKIYA